MSNVIQVVLSNARHPEYGQFTIPFPIPQDAYDDMVEALKNMEIGDPILQDCHVDELESSYSILKRLEKTNLNLDELDYLAKRLDSFDNGEAAQFQGMACKLGVSNIKDFINLTFCCQQATVITDFSDLDAIGRQHYMTMQGGGCRTEELERLDSQKFALDLILNHTEGSITPYGVVYDNGMKLEPLYDGRHFPCYHYQQDLLAVGLSSGQRPENTGQITWLLLPCSEQQLRLIAFLAEHDGSEELYEVLHDELGLTNREIEAMGFDLTHRYEPDCSDAYQDIVDYIQFEQETTEIWPWLISGDEILAHETTLWKIAGRLAASGEWDTESIYDGLTEAFGPNPLLTEEQEFCNMQRGTRHGNHKRTAGTARPAGGVQEEA